MHIYMLSAYHVVHGILSKRILCQILFSFLDSEVILRDVRDPKESILRQNLSREVLIVEKYYYTFAHERQLQRDTSVKVGILTLNLKVPQ